MGVGGGEFNFTPTYTLSQIVWWMPWGSPHHWHHALKQAHVLINDTTCDTVFPRALTLHSAYGYSTVSASTWLSLTILLLPSAYFRALVGLWGLAECMNLPPSWQQQGIISSAWPCFLLAEPWPYQPSNSNEDHRLHVNSIVKCNEECTTQLISCCLKLAFLIREPLNLPTMYFIYLYVWWNNSLFADQLVDPKQLI